MNRFAFAILLLSSALASGAPRGTRHDFPRLVSRVRHISHGLQTPYELPAPEILPGTPPEDRNFETWIDLWADADKPLWSRDEIAAHQNQRNAPEFGFGNLRAEEGDIPSHLARRFDGFRIRCANEDLLTSSGETCEVPEIPVISDVPALRVAYEALPVRCIPLEGGLFTPALDLLFDRNACSAVQPQEIIQVFETESPWLLIRSKTTLGFVPKTAALSPIVPDSLESAFLTADKFEVLRDLPELNLKAGTLCAQQGDKAIVAGPKNFQILATSDYQNVFSSTSREFTRRAFFESAFARLGEPYGWGDRENHPDCSRLVSDLFRRLGLELPRHSADQAKFAPRVVDVSHLTTDEERISALDQAQKQGIVLIQFPGHIMIYLGRDANGTPMALHSFSEYLEPSEFSDVIRRADRVDVSTLELGRNTKRRSFLERMTQLAIFGSVENPEHENSLESSHPTRNTQDLSEGCPAKAENAPKISFFLSPYRPNTKQPLNVLATSYEDLAQTSLRVREPSGREYDLDLKHYGGPPFGARALFENPAKGRWTIAIYQSEQLLACKKFDVATERKAEVKPPQPGQAWLVRDGWGPNTEALFSMFVESLFESDGEETTWKNLDVLLADSSRNWLLDHLSEGEDNKLKLEPDCADLPYILRAYFAWKLGLPMGIHACSRSRKGRATKCTDLQTNLTFDDKLKTSNPGATFLRRVIRGRAHSSSGRTLPDDENTDFYPVPLDRKSLRPGTLFADPYGHVLIVAGFVPQEGDKYGALIGADAQPDAVIGRRRFWEGSFLFTPDTTDVGAGFKAFRPLAYEHGEIVMRDNETLKNSKTFSPFSKVQYEGSKEDFYAGVQAVENPKPLDPFKRAESLLAALHEVTDRRVLAVQMGDDFMRSRSSGAAPIPLPNGSDIFLTTGPWEDFATPSRDLRLLISFDTVLQFHNQLAKQPQRFGVKPEDLQETLKRVDAQIAEGLEKNAITYQRSDGSMQRVTLAELVKRLESLEMAYNLNDCNEIRWGAPEGSDEISTCNRRAPESQRKGMEKVRGWFRTRERPAR